MKNKINPALFILLSFLFTCVDITAQPFIEDIRAFKKQDSIHMPAKKQILFIGSSSFTMWKDVQQYFSGYKIINRGFGGSTLPDVIRYTKDIIIPYQPKQVVIYCGDNDLASSDTVSPQHVLQRFKTLFELIRKDLPLVTISYVAIKPSPSRAHLLPKMYEANSLVKTFLKTQKNASFIDVFTPMMVNKKPRTDIFLEDNLHMNKAGYRIWQKTIRPYLLK